MNNRIRRFGAAFWLVLTESFRSFRFNRGLEKAATLSYYGFFAMLPLLLLLVTLASYFIASSDRALQALDEATARLSPVFNRVAVREVSALAQQRAWGVLSMLILFWSITPLTAAIRGAFGAIFKSDHILPFYKAKLRDALAVLMLLILLVLLVAGQAISSLLAAGWAQDWPLLFGTLSALIRVVIALACAVLFYVALSPVRLQVPLVVTGALSTTFLLALISPALGLILRYNPNYGVAFGSLKAIFLLFVWVYYSFAAVLFATEVMANIRRREALVIKRLFLPHAKRPKELLLGRFVRRYEPGEIVFAEGAGGREMFYMLDGSVDLTHRGRLLRRMKEGEYFGEMAMLIDSPRTAGAAAGETGAVVAAVSEENFDVVLRENPDIVRSILKEMASRLKATNEALRKAEAMANDETP